MDYFDIARLGGIRARGGNIVPIVNEYDEILAKAVEIGAQAPSLSQQKLQRKLIADLKSAGVWDRLDNLYILANDGSQDFGYINWKNPQNQITDGLRPEFIENVGIKGNSVNWVNTNVSLSNGVEAKEGAYSMGAFLPIAYRGIYTAFAAAEGGGGGVPEQSLYINGDAKLLWCPTDRGVSGEIQSVFTKPGMIQLDYNNGESQNSIAYINGREFFSMNDAGTPGLSTFDMYLLAGNIGGNPSFHCDATIGVWFSGASLRDKAQGFSDAITHYLGDIQGLANRYVLSGNAGFDVPDLLPDWTTHTIVSKVRHGVTSGWRSIVGQNGQGFEISTDGSRVSHYIKNVNNPTQNSYVVGGVKVDGVLEVIGSTFPSEGDWNLWREGVKDDISTEVGRLTAIGVNPALGHVVLAEWFASQRWIGEIEWIVIYDILLSDAEMANLDYDELPTGNIVAKYGNRKFNGLWLDESGNGMDAYLGDITQVPDDIIDVSINPNYDDAYKAILTKADELNYGWPSEIVQITQNQLILDLKAAGIWDKLEILYVPANDGGEEFGRLNWKNPSAHTLEPLLGVDWISNKGYDNTVSTGHINTNWTPLDSPENTLGDCSFVMKIEKNGTINEQIYFSVLDSDANQIGLIQAANGTDVLFCQSSIMQSTAISRDHQGVMSIIKTPSDQGQTLYYKDGAQVDRKSSAPNPSKANLPLYLLAERNSTDGVYGSSDGAFSIFSAGYGMLDKQLAYADLLIGYIIDISPELYTDLNCLGTEDVDDASGFSGQGTGSNNSVPSDISDFCLELTCNAVNNTRLIWVNPAPTIGVTYRHTFWAKVNRNNGTAQFALKISEGWEIEQGILITNTEWQYFEVFNTRTAGAGDCNFYASRGANEIGDNLLVDSYSCKVANLNAEAQQGPIDPPGGGGPPTDPPGIPKY